jgi:NADH-quinone oxidoreductase subunit E
MFQLSPVGSVAHVQVCGTTSCMICGAEDLVAVCRERIAPKPHQLSADGRFSWEEVECLGACANAPMAQIGKDYYEDLSAARLHAILDDLAAGKVPVPGPQNGRFACEPKKGLTSLAAQAEGRPALNASAALAVDIGDTVKRIDGTEVPLTTPWLGRSEVPSGPARTGPKPGRGRPADETGATVQEAPAAATGRPATEPAASPSQPARPADAGTAERPEALDAPRAGKADDLKLIRGVGPKLEALLHSLGVFHFAQIASWTGAELAWIDDNLEGFRGRASRDGWVGQAKVLAEGGDTAFSAAKKGTGV